MKGLLDSTILRKIQSVRPDRLVSLWPHNEPLGHGVSTEIVRGYNGAYTAVTLGQTGIQGTGMTSAGFDGATSYNDIYTTGLANDNLLLNPGFETAGGAPPIWANWVDNAGDGALANEVVIVHEGTDAVKMTIGLGGVCYVNQEMAVVPLTRYRFRFWTRTDAGDNAGRYAVRDVTNADWITAIVTTGVAGAAWGMVEHEFTTPAGCVLVGVYLHGSGVNTDVCYYDATEVRRVDGFLGDQGTVLALARVSGAGVWTDATARYIFTISADNQNRIQIAKSNVNNSVFWRREGANVDDNLQVAGHAELNFFCVAITWSMSGDIISYYFNGASAGAADTALGTWVGDLNATTTVIGASSTVPADEFSGDIGPVALWSEALSADEMRYLGTS